MHNLRIMVTGLGHGPFDEDGMENVEWTFACSSMGKVTECTLCCSAEHGSELLAVNSRG